MCDYCKKSGKNIFEYEMLDDWILSWSGTINEENSSHSNYAVFIDRGYLRMVDVDDSQCMDHGERVKIKFCPFCGVELNE